MRPTDLHFRPVSEQTPGPVPVPMITRDGSPLLSKITLLKMRLQEKKAHHSPSNSSQERAMTPAGFGSSEKRHVGFNIRPSNPYVGPGRYEVGSTAMKLLKRSPCQVKYKPLVAAEDFSGTGNLHYEGDRLVFEPNFTDPRKSQPFLKLKKFEDTLGSGISFGRLPT